MKNLFTQKLIKLFVFLNLFSVSDFAFSQISNVKIDLGLNQTIYKPFADSIQIQFLNKNAVNNSFISTQNFYYKWSIRSKYGTYLFKFAKDSSVLNIPNIKFKIEDFEDSIEVGLEISLLNGDSIWSGNKFIEILEPKCLSRKQFCNTNLEIRYSDPMPTGHTYSIVYLDSLNNENFVPIYGTTLWQNSPVFNPIIEIENLTENLTEQKYAFLIKNSNSNIYKLEDYFRISHLNNPFLPSYQYDCQIGVSVLPNNFQNGLNYKWYKHTLTNDTNIFNLDNPHLNTYLEPGEYYVIAELKDYEDETICYAPSNNLRVYPEISEIFVASDIEALNSENDTATLQCYFNGDTLNSPLFQVDWYKNDVFYNRTDGLMLTVSEPGSYYAKLVNSCGVESNTNTIELSQGIASKIENIEQLKKQISISPNPSFGYFNIQIDISLLNYPITYQLIDINGKEIMEPQGINSENTKIDTSKIKPSVYFIKFRINNIQNVIKKLILN